MLREGVERRTTVHQGKHVYEPWCPYCGKDQHTQYDRHRLDAGWCSGCNSVLRLSEREQYDAIEPQRLADRMREVQDGRW